MSFDRLAQTNPVNMPFAICIQAPEFRQKLVQAKWKIE
jgi:hypothetical protein